jgi:hypothetical protein
VDLEFAERPSDSSFVDLIWRTQSEHAGSFISTAGSQWEMVISRYRGENTFTVRGPETKASHADYPPEAEFFGIRFKLGAFMPHFPPGDLKDRNDATLPLITRQSFWLLGLAWELPTYENADTFVQRLVRDGLLVYDPLVPAALQHQPIDLSPRSVQRRFLRATGLTQGAVFQIERARQAMALLQGGVSILDTVEQLGYADQPHLTRSLKQLVGQTPAQLLRAK